MLLPSPERPLCLQLLGPLRLWRNATEVPTGPPQQTHLLAVLLARANTPVSTTELVELIWQDEAPSSARNILHKYVGALRRLLQPAVPPRLTGSFLLRRGDGYLLKAGPEIADVVAFRQQVATARRKQAEDRPAEALEHYLTALGLWRGPAAAGLGQAPTAVATFAALDGEFIGACLETAGLSLAQERPGRVLPALSLAASMAPMHEGLQAALIRALAADDQQAQALSTFTSVRKLLADELGVDPSPALLAAHQWVLNRPTGAGLVVPPSTPLLAGVDSTLVGRTQEVTHLREALHRTFDGATALVVLEGEPGSGKSRLLQEAADQARAAGAVVLSANCTKDEATPPMRRWQESFTDDGTDGDRARDSQEDGQTSHLRLHERILAAVSEISAMRPLLLAVDDLHWAGPESLRTLEHLTARLPGGVMLACTLREHDPAPSADLSRLLASFARQTGHRRIQVGPLTQTEVAELVRQQTGRTQAPEAVRLIHSRTAGNAFLAQELTRTSDEASTVTAASVARAGVPGTVRDVVRTRIRGLNDPALLMLQAAALLGPQVDLGLLAHTADLRIPTCLDLLEPLLELGLLERLDGQPYGIRFRQDLVREAVAASVPPGRAGRIHLRAAASVQSVLPATDLADPMLSERLAYHLWAAGPLLSTAPEPVNEHSTAAADPSHPGRDRAVLE